MGYTRSAKGGFDILGGLGGHLTDGMFNYDLADILAV